MAVRIADTLGKMGGGDYPLVLAIDIDLSDGTNLQDFLDDLILSVVQADWEQDDSSAPDFIKNKPIFIDDLHESSNTTYSSNKINTIVEAIGGIRHIAVVEELPEEDIDVHTLYLVPNDEPQPNNYHDEYLYISNRWELIGNTHIDLSDYYTKSEVDGLLDDKVDKVQGKGLSTNDYTDADKEKVNNSLQELPVASSNTLGGVKVGNGLEIDENGVLSTDGTDSEMVRDVTANTNVGGIASGTTLSEGTTFTEFVEKLVVIEIAPTLSFSLSKSGNVAYGTSYTETLTVACSNMGTAKSIDAIEWYEGNTLLRTDNVASETTGSWSYTMETETVDTTTFKAIIKYKKSNNEQVYSTKTATISFYYNKFYGVVNDLAPSEATVEALSKSLGTSRGGTYSFTSSAQRIAYAYPSSLGALTTIKDGNGFSLFNSFTRTTVTYTQNNTSVEYYLYVLTDSATVSNYSVTFG